MQLTYEFRRKNSTAEPWNYHYFVEMLRFLERLVQGQVKEFTRRMLQQQLTESFSIQDINTFESMCSDELKKMNAFFKKQSHLKKFLIDQKLNNWTIQGQRIHNNAFKGQRQDIKPQTNSSVDTSTITISNQIDEIRQFSLAEVVAYALYNKYYICLQKSPQNNNKGQQKKNLQQAKDDFFIDLDVCCKNLVKIVKEETPTRKGETQMQRQRNYNSVRIELAINIRRRFYQMANWRGFMYDLASKIEAQFGNMANELSSYMHNPETIARYDPKCDIQTHTFANQDNILKIIEIVSPKDFSQQNQKQNEQNGKDAKLKGKYHYFVGDFFRAMYSPTSEEDGFCPYTVMQERFYQASKKPAKYETGAQVKQNNTSMAFIPSKIGTEITRHLRENHLYVSMSGFKFMGKSMSLVAFVTLEQLHSNILLIPSFIQLQPQNLKISIFEGFWKGMSQKNLQKLKNIPETNKFVAINQILDIPLRSNSTVILDQFQTFVGKMYKKNDKKSEAYQILTKLKCKFSKIVLASSISIESYLLEDLLHAPEQQITLYEFTGLFRNGQALQLVRVWIKRLLSLEQSSLTEEQKSIITLKQDIIFCFLDIAFTKQQKQSQLQPQEFYLEASMDQIKKIAMSILQKLIPLQNKQNEKGYKSILNSKKEQLKIILQKKGPISEDEVDKIKKIEFEVKRLMNEESIEWYVDASRKWISKGQIIAQQLYRLTIITEILEKGQHFIKELDDKSKLIPMFLCDKDERILPHLKKNAKEIMSRVKSSTVTKVNSTSKMIFRELIKMRGKDISQMIFTEFIKMKSNGDNSAAFGTIVQTCYNAALRETELNTINHKFQYKNLIKVLEKTGLKKEQEEDVPIILFQKKEQPHRIFQKIYPKIEENLQNLVKQFPNKHSFYFYFTLDFYQPQMDGILVKVTKDQLCQKYSETTFNSQIIIIEFKMNADDKDKLEFQEQIQKQISSIRDFIPLWISNKSIKITCIKDKTSNSTQENANLRGVMFTTQTNLSFQPFQIIKISQLSFLTQGFQQFQAYVASLPESSSNRKKIDAAEMNLIKKILN